MTVDIEARDRAANKLIVLRRAMREVATVVIFDHRLTERES